ncbi:MAG: hypothetical protein P8Y58_02990 [Novosphingobium sp.]
MAESSEISKGPSSSESSSKQKTSDKFKDWYDDWIVKLAGDGGELPSVTGMFGYIGQSPEPGRLRLYVDPHLLQCIEFDSEHVVHRLAATGEGSALGGSFLWISNEGWSTATTLWRQI